MIQTTNTIDKNPDDDLSIYGIIMKYQTHFTKYFGPKYAYGVVSAVYRDAKSICVTARVKPVHQSTKGKITDFIVPISKFDTWRLNIKLFDFISDK